MLLMCQRTSHTIDVSRILHKTWHHLHGNPIQYQPLILEIMHHGRQFPIYAFKLSLMVEGVAWIVWDG